MHVDRDGGDVLMVAGSTGLAPLRSIIMDLTPLRRESAGAPVLRRPLSLRSLRPEDAVAGRVDQPVAVGDPGVGVLHQSAVGRPTTPTSQPPRGLHVRQTGTLPDVVTRYGGWGDRQILVCGGPQMVEATKAALIAKGARSARASNTIHSAS